MFNILLVDDEELICKGLKSMIERSNLSEVGTVNYTTEPAKVQLIVEEFRPHIIIVDINMPEITGLDLIRNIPGKYSGIKFIVLSGYDDFKYVKEAFKLGASDYLLKPSSIDELKSILDKVIGTIKEEERVIQNLQNNTNKYMEAILENRLNKVFNGSNCEELNIEGIFNELDICFPYNFFNVGILSLYSNHGEVKNIENVKYFLDRIGDVITDKNEMSVYYFYDFSNKLVFLFNYSDKVDAEKSSQYLQTLIDLLRESVGGDYFAAISNPETDVNGLIDCYMQAKEISDYKLLFDFNQVVKASSIRSDEEVKENFYLQLASIKDCIKNLNTIAISDKIDIIFSRENVQKLSIKRFEKLYRKIINIIEDVVNDYGLFYFNKEFKELSSFVQLSDLRIYLKTMILNIINLCKAKGTEKSISGIVKKYVQENYHKDIDMSVVSNLVSLSYSHFSKIFKDETGMNFSEYLQKVRLEKALEILSNPTSRIQEIAYNVGFSNPKHFTRAFKNYFGFSPSEYRIAGNKAKRRNQCCCNTHLIN